MMNRMAISGLIAAALMAFAATPAAAQMKGNFDLGLTGDWTKWKSSTSIKVPGALVNLGKISKSGIGLGAVARYTAPITNSGVFAGIHLGLRAGLGNNYNGTASGTVLGVPATGKATVKTKWTADLLARVGMQAGKFSPYVGAGVSMLNGSEKSTLTGPGGSISSSDTNTHIGWKIALGGDVMIAKNIVSFLQFEYAQYGSKTYNLFGIPVSADMKTIGARLGVAYRF